MKQGDKGYIPIYGWFGRAGNMVNESAGMVWFNPDHAAEASGRVYIRSVIVPFAIIRPIEWPEGWELRDDWKRALRGR